MRCKLCLSERLKELFISLNIHGRHILGNDKFSIYQCQDCKITFTSTQVDEEYYKKYYAKGYYPDKKYNSCINAVLIFLQKLSFNNRLKLIKKYSPKAKRILEIGCGRGEFLKFIPSVFEKHGIEINPEAHKYIKDNCKDILVYDCNLDNVDFNAEGYGKYDVIIMWHVLEHISNPAVFLNNVVKLLDKEGAIIFAIPNRDSIGFNLAKKYWFHLDSPRHLFHYTKKDMYNLLQKQNLEIVHYKGEVIDYFQDLTVSLCMLFNNKNIFFKVFAYLLLVPIITIGRFLIAIFISKRAEINTYVAKHS